MQKAPCQHENYRFCGAKTRAGTPCRAPAIRNRARCRMHGGKSPGRPIIHGNYCREDGPNLTALRERAERYERALNPGKTR